MFSPDGGGVVCSACQTIGDYYIPLSRDNHRLLVRLQNSSYTEATGLSIKYIEATNLLDMLVTFVSYQTGTISSLKSLEFLKKLGKSQKVKDKGTQPR